MKIDHIYCINLERSKDRRVFMENEFEREGLDSEFFKACDGKLLGRDGVFGCAQSHLQVWKDMVEHGYENAIILEDDAKLVDNFKTKIEELVEPGTEWDILYLFSLGAIFNRDCNESFYEGKSMSTLGYVISKACADRLCRLSCDDIDCAIDEFIAVKMNLKTFISKSETVLYDFKIQSTNSEIGLVASRQITRWGLEHFIKFVYSKFGTYILFILLFLLSLVLYIRLRR
jgi:GR25 family glycosyltransferase involved in LPS biosynthesis